MKQNRVERIFAALKDMGLTQMLIVDPDVHLLSDRCVCGAF